MNALDLKGPPPQPKTLEEAQQVIDALWGALGETRERVEQLEERVLPVAVLDGIKNTH